MSILNLDVGILNKERKADRFSGANDSAKIASAITNLPAVGGTVDATGLEGNRVWNSNPFTGVTKPVTLIMNAGTTQISANITIPDNINIIMPAGAIFSVDSGLALTLSVSGVSSLTRHFMGVGRTFLRSPLIHTRWFDDGSHSHNALQLAINSVGFANYETGQDPVLRQGKIIHVNDILILADTVLCKGRSVTIDCGGRTALHTSNNVAISPTPGGLVWDGPANQPMLLFFDTTGCVVQNSRFYGKTGANRARSAISFGTSGATSNCIIRNCHIGMMFGDPGYDQFDSLIDGIRIGDSYAGGVSGTCDNIEISNCLIFGVTNAPIRQSSIQNSMLHVRNVNTFGSKYGVQITSTASIYQSFFAACSESVIFTPGTDDYSLQTGPKIWGTDIESEQSARLILMNGSATIDLKGVLFQLGSSTIADRNIIYGSSNEPQIVYVKDLFVAGSNWGVSLKAGPGQSAQKYLRLHGNWGSDPIIDMDSQNGFDVHLATRELSFLNGVDIINRVSNQFPWSQNVLIGNGTELSAFDASKFHIPTKGLRIGDSQNGAGAHEISTATQLLTLGSTGATAVGLFPANSLVIGATTRNENAISVTPSLSLVVHTAAGSSDGNNVTTIPIDTSNADFIVLAVAWYEPTSLPTILDNKGNTWNVLGTSKQSGGESCTLLWCKPTSVGLGHTFSANSISALSYPSIAVAAFKGIATSPFDVEAGAVSGSAVGNPLSIGPLTPSSSGRLFVTAIASINGSTTSIDSSFVITDYVNFLSTAHFGIALAYKIRTDAAAETPTWTIASLYQSSGRIAAFVTSAGVAIVRVGSVANATKWNANLGLTDHSKTSIADWNLAVVPTPYFIQSPEDVVISITGGTINSGSTWVTGHYINLIPPPGKF